LRHLTAQHGTLSTLTYGPLASLRAFRISSARRGGPQMARRAVRLIPDWVVDLVKVWFAPKVMGRRGSSNVRSRKTQVRP